ncbi:MAG: hypothetical protein M3343_11285 [Actinomycetota bacterium]|nr:hypothetical protein [Actinomycetota bacterium]
MTLSTAPTTAPRPDDIIESLATIVSGVDSEIVFITCVDQDGYVSDSEAYASKDQPKTSLPLEHLFSFPRTLGMGTIMVTSRACEPLGTVGEDDLEFTRGLLEAASAEGVEVLDHVVVRDGDYRRLREITDLWD